MSKFHLALQSLAADINGRQPKTSVTYEGRTYELEILKPEWEEWVVSEVVGASAAAIVLNSRLPTIAAALTSIDDTKVEDLVSPDDSLPADLRSDPRVMRMWRKRELLKFLRENVDEPWIDALYGAYAKMSKQYKDDVAALAAKDDVNLAKRTP